MNPRHRNRAFGTLPGGLMFLLVWIIGTVATSQECDRVQLPGNLLKAGESLSRGQYFFSKDGRYRAEFTCEGRLAVLSHSDGLEIATQDIPEKATKILLLNDGSLQLVDQSDKEVQKLGVLDAIVSSSASSSESSSEESSCGEEDKAAQLRLDNDGTLWTLRCGTSRWSLSAGTSESHRRNELEPVIRRKRDTENANPTSTQAENQRETLQDRGQSVDRSASDESCDDECQQKKQKQDKSKSKSQQDQSQQSQQSQEKRNSKSKSKSKERSSRRRHRNSRSRSRDQSDQSDPDQERTQIKVQERTRHHRKHHSRSRSQESSQQERIQVIHKRRKHHRSRSQSQEQKSFSQQQSYSQESRSRDHDLPPDHVKVTVKERHRTRHHRPRHYSRSRSYSQEQEESQQQGSREQLRIRVKHRRRLHRPSRSYERSYSQEQQQSESQQDQSDSQQQQQLRIKVKQRRRYHRPSRSRTRSRSYERSYSQEQQDQSDSQQQQQLRIKVKERRRHHRPSRSYERSYSREQDQSDSQQQQQEQLRIKVKDRRRIHRRGSRSWSRERHHRRRHSDEQSQQQEQERFQVRHSIRRKHRRRSSESQQQQEGSQQQEQQQLQIRVKEKRKEHRSRSQEQQQQEQQQQQVEQQQVQIKVQEKRKRRSSEQSESDSFEHTCQRRDCAHNRCGRHGTCVGGCHSFGHCIRHQEKRYTCMCHRGYMGRFCHRECRYSEWKDYTTCNADGWKIQIRSPSHHHENTQSCYRDHHRRLRRVPCRSHKPARKFHESIARFCRTRMDGLNPVGRCSNVYVSCISGQARVITCPSNYAYSPMKRMCLPESFIQECREIKHNCRAKGNGPHKLGPCRNDYLLCVGPMGFTRRCAEGKVYSEKIHGCTHAHQAPECSSIHAKRGDRYSKEVYGNAPVEAPVGNYPVAPPPNNNYNNYPAPRVGDKAPVVGNYPTESKPHYQSAPVPAPKPATYSNTANTGGSGY